MCWAEAGALVDWPVYPRLTRITRVRVGAQFATDAGRRTRARCSKKFRSVEARSHARALRHDRWLPTAARRAQDERAAANGWKVSVAAYPTADWAFMAATPIGPYYRPAFADPLFDDFP